MSKDTVLNLSGVPTGNLYKFCAIAGIFLIFGGPLFFYKVELSHREAYINEKRNFVEMQHMASLMRIDVQQLLDKRSNGLISSYEFIAEIEVLHKKLRELANLTKDHVVAVENIGFLYDDLDRARILMYFSLLTGILISGFGFFRWLTITQKNEDIKQLSETKKS